MNEITSDMLYWLFKDIPEGIAPCSPGYNYAGNIFEPDIDYSEGMSDSTGTIGIWMHAGTSFTVGVNKTDKGWIVNKTDEADKKEAD